MCTRFARCAILETYRMCSETFLNCSTLMHKFSMILLFFPIYHHFTFFLSLMICRCFTKLVNNKRYEIIVFYYYHQFNHVLLKAKFDWQLHTLPFCHHKEITNHFVPVLYTPSYMCTHIWIIPCNKTDNVNIFLMML